MKTFKEFLLEYPMINPHIDKSGFRKTADRFIREPLEKNQETHEHIYGDYYKHKEGSTQYYFRKSGSSIKELSGVNADHVHKVTDKGVGGDVSHIHNFMEHHAEKHGKISSDTDNTEGSKKLWTSLVKSKPKNKTFHIVNDKTKEERPVDHSTIDKESDYIWGKSPDKRNIRIEMRHRK